MEEEEIICFECNKNIMDSEVYECDYCRNKIHKNCLVLSATETRVMPIQKHVLMFMCNTCKLLMKKLPYMAKMIEDLKQTLNDLKTEMELSKGNEIEALKQTVKVTTDKNNELTRKLLNLENNTNGYPNTTYANITSKRSATKINREVVNVPSLIIKPKSKQNAEKTKQDVCNTIKPVEMKVGIKTTRSTRNGSIVIKCQTKEEIEAVKHEAEKNLDKEYDIQVTKLRKPRIKIIGCNEHLNSKQIEDCIREQNHFINDSDELRITYIKTNKNKDTTTVFGECSPALFHKFMEAKKVFINWERYPIYEDISITRCFRCQGHYHKYNECNKKPVCEYCSEEHSVHECPKRRRRCANCAYANMTYKTKYNIEHETSDRECPTYKYLIEILRSKIDYGYQ